MTINFPSQCDKIVQKLNVLVINRFQAHHIDTPKKDNEIM